MRTGTIGHLSHGVVETGGFRHEQQLMNALAAYFPACKTVTQRTYTLYNGLAHLQLLWWGFVNASFDVNIVVARCALSAIVRNMFNAKKVLIVLHNHDESDYNGTILKLYFRLLFMVLRIIPFRHVAIVAVAPFWVDYFKGKTKQHIPVLLFPNLFDQRVYNTYKKTAKKKQIHLGQYSPKNDERIFELAAKLTQEGYLCYFTTLLEHQQGVHPHYEIRYGSVDTYLNDMSESEYTVAYIAVNEGWNRIAHESLLVGTPVIGVNKGGLGDLLTASGSLKADTVDEFLALIRNHSAGADPAGFLAAYDAGKQLSWVEPTAEFCKA